MPIKHNLAGLMDSTGQPVSGIEMLSKLRMLHTSQIPNNLVVGSSSDCTELYLGDFTRLAFMLRENVSVQVLRESFATTGEIGFIGHVRADVALMYPAAFAVVKGVR